MSIFHCQPQTSRWILSLHSCILIRIDTHSNKVNIPIFSSMYRITKICPLLSAAGYAIWTLIGHFSSSRVCNASRAPHRQAAVVADSSIGARHGVFELDTVLFSECLNELLLFATRYRILSTLFAVENILEKKEESLC